MQKANIRTSNSWLPLWLVLALGLAACNTGVKNETLENHTWVLTQYAADGVKEQIADQETQLQFSAGNLTGHTGCNRIAGRYQLKNSRLSTEELLTTEMACPGVMERENNLLRALNAGPTLAMDGDDMLMSGDGVVLTFRLIQ